MKLVNYLLYRSVGVIFLVIFLWSVAYFFFQMYEIHDGIDEGLLNLKQEFVLDANTSPHFVEDMQKHNPLNIMVEEITQDEALPMREKFYTTQIYFETEQEKEEVRMLETAFYCESNQKYYRLKVFTSTVESDDLIKNILYLQMALLLVLGLLLYFTSRSLLEKIFQPFYKLLEQLKKFKLGKSEMFDLPETSIREFKELNQSVDILLQSNIKTYQDQKTFIENASHELQTPLAVTIGKLELLIGEKNITQEQAKSIATIIEILNRTKRLNSNLLLLSKIKNKQFPESEQLDLSEIFMQVSDEYEDLIHHREITVEISGKEHFIVQMNKDLAFILANNIIKNAIIHNLSGGFIRLIFSEKSIEIRNTGPQPEINDIFERYQTQSAQSQSLGLGLSIVKSIIDLYQMKISYMYENEHIMIIR